MKKIKLQLEDLAIDSFATTAPKKAEGTVFGEQCTCSFCTCRDLTCDHSCYETCGNEYSCVYTCDGYGAPGCASYATAPGPEQECMPCMG